MVLYRNKNKMLILLNLKHISIDEINKDYGNDWLYIGRRSTKYNLTESILHNPFVGKRYETIEKYRHHLWKMIKNKNEEVIQLLDNMGKGKYSALVCYCAPLPCHGDIIIMAANWLIKESYAK